MRTLQDSTLAGADPTKAVIFVDHHDTVTINSDGWGEFIVNGGSNSVWVQK